MMMDCFVEKGGEEVRMLALFDMLAFTTSSRLRASRVFSLSS